MVRAFLAVAAAVASFWYLAIYNGLLMGFGLVIVVRGLYYRFIDSDVDGYLEMSGLSSEEEFHKLVIFTFILPGVVMIVLGCVGFNGASKENKHILIIYCSMVIILMVLNCYGRSVLDSNVFSLLSYVNRISTRGGDFSLPNGISSAEFAIQISAFVAAFYIVLCMHLIERQKRREIAAAAILAQMQRQPENTHVCFEITETTFRIV